MTGYRLLNTSVVFSFGLTKAMLTYMGRFTIVIPQEASAGTGVRLRKLSYVGCQCNKHLTLRTVIQRSKHFIEILNVADYPKIH
jgi:hypothetical protein